MAASQLWTNHRYRDTYGTSTLLSLLIFFLTISWQRSNIILRPITHLEYLNTLNEYIPTADEKCESNNM